MSVPFAKTKDADRIWMSRTHNVNDSAKPKFHTKDSQRLQEENDETQSDEKVPSYKKLDKKVNAVVRNWTCQAKDADAERKFHAKVEKNLFRNSRNSFTNQNLKLSDGWLMMDASIERARTLSCTDKLAVKSADSIDSVEAVKPNNSIRISNLPETMTKTDLSEMVRKIGFIQKTFMKRNRQTGLCEGFAYVTFKCNKDAAKAIELLNGHGYDHSILKAEWSKP